MGKTLCMVRWLDRGEYVTQTLLIGNLIRWPGGISSDADLQRRAKPYCDNNDTILLRDCEDWRPLRSLHQDRIEDNRGRFTSLKLPGPSAFARTLSADENVEPSTGFCRLQRDR